MSSSTATGIFQSDLVIRMALIEGMKIIRNTPYLLDSVIRGITVDTLTNKLYGQKELDALKKWYKNTEVPVILYRTGGAVTPSISLALVASTINAETLGDVHYDPFEPISDDEWLVIAGPFEPMYDPDTGLMTLPESLEVDVFPGMAVLDSKGTAYTINSISSNVSPISFFLDEDINTSFQGATIRGSTPSVLEEQGSVKFKESWSIGVHVHSEAGQLQFLHSIITFILLWGKESLFEARGFELSDFSSTDFARNQAFDDGELAWTRFVNLNGITQQVFPKRRTQRIVGVNSQLQIIGGENVPSSEGDISNLTWVGDEDDDAF